MLSICIPTYKRLNFLRKLLDELLPQAQRLGVSVFVSDNASNDGTKEYLSEITKHYECLTCVFGDKNVTIDENMQRVMSLPKSKYIFPLGDDDWIPEGALENVLKYLDTSPDLLALRFKVVDYDLVCKKFFYPPHLSGKTFSNPVEAFSELWELMHFGAFVVKNDFQSAWFEKYRGTCHAYSGVIWEYLANKYNIETNVSIICSEDILVLIRSAGKTWDEYRQDVVYKMIPMWLDALPEMYISSAKLAKYHYFKRMTSYKSIVKLRKKKLLDRKNVEYYSGNASFGINLKIMLVAYCPVFISRILHKILHYCSR